MKRYKATFAGRMVLFAVIIAIIVGIVAGVSYLIPIDNSVDEINNTAETNKTNNVNNVETQKPKPTTDSNKNVAEDVTINLSLDEWVGWETILFANGGEFETTKGSIYDELGINVKIHIINDAEASSNALIKGDLNAAGYTLNRTAFLSNKFTNAGLDIVIPSPPLE